MREVDKKDLTTEQLSELLAKKLIKVVKANPQVTTDNVIKALTTLRRKVIRDCAEGFYN